jgi:Tol biopolymer transport system component
MAIVLASCGGDSTASSNQSAAEPTAAGSVAIETTDAAAEVEPVAAEPTAVGPVAVETTDAAAVVDATVVLPGEPWLVFAWYEGKRTKDLVLMRPDGSDRHVILDDLAGEHKGPSWSPDGERIAFVNVDVATPLGSIWTVNADGSDPALLTDGEGQCPDGIFHPSWSPDGSKLAVVCYPDPGGMQGSVATFDLATGTLTRLTTVDWPEHLDGAPRWSPDGSSLAFVIQHWDPTNTFLDGSLIAVMSSEAGPEARITSFDTNMSSPDWSPTGSELVISTNDLGNIQTTDQPSNLYAISPDGTTLRQITRSSVDGSMRIAQPRWSPDGSRIVVSVATAGNGTRVDDVQLAYVDPNGGEPVLFSPTIHGSQPELRPTG